jgi:O-antigen ligase
MILVGTVFYIIGILWLFFVDRERQSRTSWAIWISTVWVLLGASRMVSQWLDMGPVYSANQYLDGSPLDRNILTGLLVLGLGVLIRRHDRVAALLRINGWMIALLCYGALSMLWSDYPDVTFKRWIKALGDFVMVMIVLTDMDCKAARRQFLARVGFLLIPVSVMFIKYYPALGRTYSRWEGKMFYTGVASDKNMLGMICLIFGLACLWRFMQVLRTAKSAVRNKRLLAHGVVLVMTVWLLWRANSVTSISCFVMAGTLMVLVSFPGFGRKRVLVHLVVASGLAISLSALFLNAGGLVQALGRDPTLTGRTDLWKAVVAMNPNQFLGAGFESFWLGTRLEKVWSLFGWHPNEAHNGYLEIYLNLGWIGILLYATVIVIGYRNVMRALRLDPESGRLRLAYFFVGVAYSFTEAGFRMMNPVWVAFLLAIIAVPLVPKLSARPVQSDMAKVRIPENQVAQVF